MAAVTATILTFIGLSIVGEVVGEGFFKLAERVRYWMSESSASDMSKGIPLDLSQSFIGPLSEFTEVPGPTRPAPTDGFGDNLTAAAAALYGREEGIAISRLFFSSFGLEASGKSEGSALESLLQGSVPLMKNRLQRII